MEVEDDDFEFYDVEACHDLERMYEFGAGAGSCVPGLDEPEPELGSHSTAVPFDAEAVRDRFEQVRALARADIKGSAAFLERFNAAFLYLGEVAVAPVPVVAFGPVGIACNVVGATECLKPSDKCARCTFYRAKLAGVELVLYGKGEQVPGSCDAKLCDD